MAHLSLGVLGSLQVLVDNIPVTAFESDKVRALLAYLAVEADRSHTRSTLIGLLWPEFPEPEARHSLSQALFNLRLAIGDHTASPAYLLISRDAIQFSRESDYSLDLAQFNAVFDAWEKNRDQEGEDVSNLVTRLEEMVALYRGEFLQQFSLEDSAEFEEWMLVQREALHQHVLDILTYLADHFEGRGEYLTARRYASRQLELDPWREEAHGQLMRVLAMEGQRSAALAQFETCRRVLAEELGVEPSQKTRDLYDQIRLGQLKPRAEPPSLTSFAPIHNLPVSLTPFIGREAELAELGQMITDPQCRWISLVGPGGIGKTRLALQIAEQHANEFAHGSAFIPLASVGSVEAVVPAIASSIHFDFYGPIDPKTQLLTYLRDKQMLLVVDNVEHLLVEEASAGTIAELLMGILQQAAGVKLLVTSREALCLQEECLYEVQGLSFPKEEETDDTDEYSAMILFGQRARRARPGFVLNGEDRVGAARICRLVEGMPLAIELAATWVRLLSPAEIAAEIEHSLDFLNAQMRDLPERHRSMRAVFDHTWQLLSAEEQQALGKLSVFQGGLSRPAAEQVAGATLPILSSLVTRSLLKRTATGRYDLHELVRQYAAARLAVDRSELHAAQERHSQYYLGLLGEKEGELRSQRQKEALAELTVEMDNLRTAWDWSTRHQVFLPLYRASTAFWNLFELANWFTEGEAKFWQTAEALRAYVQDEESEDSLHQTILHTMLAHCGSFVFRQGRSEEAYARLVPTAAFLRKSSDPLPLIYCLGYLGITCWELGRFSEAKETLLESLDLAHTHQARWSEAVANEFLGALAHDQGDNPLAQQYLMEALSIYRQVGDPSMTAHVLSYLGRSLQALGEYAEAEKLLLEGLGLTRQMNYRFGSGLTLDALGQIAYGRGRYAEAENFFSESAHLFRNMGDTHRLARTLNHLGMNSLAQQDFAKAEMAYREALTLAHEGGLTPSTLNALTGLAVIATHERASLEYFGIIIFILSHVACNEETKSLATQLQAELESQLSPNEVKEAELRAGSLNLDELVRRVLVHR